MNSRSSCLRDEDRGFSLLELMMVLAIMSIVAGIMMVSTEGAPVQTLQEASSVLAGDLILARDAALTYGTEYTVQFNLSSNSYSVSHTGSANPPALERPLGNGSTGDFTVSLGGGHPGGNMGSKASLYRVRTVVTGTDVTAIVFNSRGNTGPVRSEDTAVWLTQGSGENTRYQKLTVNWVTGQVWTSAVSAEP